MCFPAIHAQTHTKDEKIQTIVEKNKKYLEPNNTVTLDAAIS